MALTNEDIQAQFQQHLGRPATAAEMSQLMQYGSTGGIDLTAGDIGDILQSLPEYQKSQTNQIANQYAGNMTKYNDQILGRASDMANANFAENGRQWSSGQGNSVIQAGQQLAAQQAPDIASFYANGQMGQLQNQYNLGMNARQFGQGQQLSGQDWRRQLYSQAVNYDNQMNAMTQGANLQNRLSMQSGLAMAPLTLTNSFLGGAGGGIGAEAGKMMFA